MKKYYSEVDVAKGIVILLVVFGHSFPDASISTYNNSFIYQQLNSIIYSFHMAAFFFISGFLSHSTISKLERNKISSYIFKKIKSILIPYIIISVLSFFLKLLFNEHAYSKITPFDGVIGIMSGDSPNGGMWFLYALFFIELLCPFVYKISYKIILPLSVISAMLLSPYGYSDNMICKILYHFSFFIIGFYINKSYDHVQIKWKKSVSIVLFMGLLSSNLLIGKRIAFVSAMFGVFLVFLLARQISDNKNNLVYRSLKELGKYSMDIYVLSYFVQIPVRVVLFEMLNINYEICICIMFFSGIMLPYYFGKFLFRKNFILNTLFLGGRI